MSCAFSVSLKQPSLSINLLSSCRVHSSSHTPTHTQLVVIYAIFVMWRDDETCNNVSGLQPLAFCSLSLLLSLVPLSSVWLNFCSALGCNVNSSNNNDGFSVKWFDGGRCACVCVTKRKQYWLNKPLNSILWWFFVSFDFIFVYSTAEKFVVTVFRFWSFGYWFWSNAR